MKHLNFFNYRKLIYFFLIINLFAFLLIPLSLSAQDNPLDVLEQTGGQAGYSLPTGDINELIDTTIGQIIAVVLGFLGIIFLVLIIYSGFQWMTAGGNEDTITAAKKRLTNAVSGLGIVLAAWIITFFVIWNLYEITTGQGGGGGINTGG